MTNLVTPSQIAHLWGCSEFTRFVPLAGPTNCVHNSWSYCFLVEAVVTTGTRLRFVRRHHHHHHHLIAIASQTHSCSYCLMDRHAKSRFQFAQVGGMRCMSIIIEQTTDLMLIFLSLNISSNMNCYYYYYYYYYYYVAGMRQVSTRWSRRDKAARAGTVRPHTRPSHRLVVNRPLTLPLGT